MNKINKKELDWLTLATIKDCEEGLFFYKEKDIIVGFYSYEVNNQTLSILIYVYEKYFNQNIEDKIYEEVINKVRKEKYNKISVEFLDNKNKVNFYENKGFKINYISVKMILELNKIDSNLIDKITNTETNIIEKYNDCYFDEVNKVASDAFYSVLKDNNLKPYRSSWSQSYREWLNSSELDCFVIKENKEIAGFSCIKGNEIDKVLVNPKYQKRGYGKLLTIHAIKFIINKGYDNMYLYRLINNPTADKIYKSLGFISIGNIVVMEKKL